MTPERQESPLNFAKVKFYYIRTFDILEVQKGLLRLFGKYYLKEAFGRFDTRCLKRPFCELATWRPLSHLDTPSDTKSGNQQTALSLAFWGHPLSDDPEWPCWILHRSHILRGWRRSICFGIVRIHSSKVMNFSHRLLSDSVNSNRWNQEGWQCFPNWIRSIGFVLLSAESCNPYFWHSWCVLCGSKVTSSFVLTTHYPPSISSHFPTTTLP